MNTLTKKEPREASAACAIKSAKNLPSDPRVDALVEELIGRVADKWTMLILEALTENGEMRFTRIGACVGKISQKMLTQTLRQMERDGLVARTVHPVIPPHVDYKLTPLGASLSEAFCGVWIWAGEHLKEIESARAKFDVRRAKAAAKAATTRTGGTG